MATVTMVAVERSGPAIRAALAEHGPDDEARFTAEFREALVRAGEDLGLAGAAAVLTRWPPWPPTRCPATSGPSWPGRGPTSPVLRVRRARHLDHHPVTAHPVDVDTPEIPPRSRLVWLQIADQQYHDLPENLRRLVGRRIAALLENPTVDSDAVYKQALRPVERPASDDGFLF